MVSFWGTVFVSAPLASRESRHRGELRERGLRIGTRWRPVAARRGELCRNAVFVSHRWRQEPPPW